MTTDPHAPFGSLVISHDTVDKFAQVFAQAQADIDAHLGRMALKMYRAGSRAGQLVDLPIRATLSMVLQSVSCMAERYGLHLDHLTAPWLVREAAAHGKTSYLPQGKTDWTVGDEPAYIFTPPDQWRTEDGTPLTHAEVMTRIGQEDEDEKRPAEPRTNLPAEVPASASPPPESQVQAEHLQRIEERQRRRMQLRQEGRLRTKPAKEKRVELDQARGPFQSPSWTPEPWADSFVTQRVSTGTQNSSMTALSLEDEQVVPDH